MLTTASLLPTFEARAISGTKSVNMDPETLLQKVIERRDMIRPYDEKDVLLTQYRFGYEEGSNTLFMEGRGEKRFVVHPLVEQQICSLLGVEPGFRKYAPVNFPGALNEAINTHPWFRKDRILRIAESGGEKIVRAIVSPSYGFLDDLDWLPEVVEALVRDKDNEWTATHLSISDITTHIRFSSKREENVTVGDVVRKSIDFRNSEVAMGGLRVQYLYHILRCQNGMMSDHEQDMMSTTHRGTEKVDAFRYVFQSVLESALNGGWDKIRELYSRAGEIQVSEEEALDIVTSARRILGLTIPMSKKVQEEFQSNPLDSTLFSLSQAFSRTAQDYSGYEDRFILEKAGGKLLSKRTMNTIGRKDIASQLIAV